MKTLIVFVLKLLSYVLYAPAILVELLRYAVGAIRLRYHRAKLASLRADALEESWSVRAAAIIDAKEQANPGYVEEFCSMWELASSSGGDGAQVYARGLAAVARVWDEDLTGVPAEAFYRELVSRCSP
ncbi:MAG: hypothetical protein ACRD02_13165 [Acidimicrobiia bacterium]